MTPFDPAALLAMLLAFYQPATVENLARAMRDRPEYFAGGVPIGHSGDAMQLPDGRIFDLIFSVGGADARYQVLYKPATSGAGGDPFPLEDGPLSPVDPATLAFPLPREPFVDLVGGALRDVGGHFATIDARQADVLSISDSAAFDGASDAAIAEGAGAHAAHGSAFDAADPVSVIVTTNGQSSAVDGHRAGYNDTPPPERPVHDPGPPPHGGVGDHPKV